MNKLKKEALNKNMKLTWPVLQAGILQAEEWGAGKTVIKALKRIKTLDEFKAHGKAPCWLLWYAAQLNKGRVKAFEEIIAKESDSSLSYCRHVAKRRIKAFEAIISTNPICSHLYCLHVVGHRIKALEASIANSPVASYYYCAQVANCKIIKMASIIKKNGRYWKQYLAISKNK